MDDGDNQETFLRSMGDSFIDELLLKDAHTCIHIHTCNISNDDSTADAESVEKKTKKRALVNRESVRKYREKKKARSASLEDEAVRLKAVNQQLLKRLQGQAALEAEVARLKCLLVDIRGRIEGEIGSFPYQKNVKTTDMFQTFAHPGLPGSYMIGPCNDIQCANPGRNEQVCLNGQGFSGSGFETLNCFVDMGTGSKDFLDYGACGMGNLASTANSSGDGIRKGANDEATTG